MTKTQWFPANTHPSRRGWYERDHRSVFTYINPEDRKITLDLWEPVRNPADILFPGVWYVKGEPYVYTNPFTGESKLIENINDASKQNLPWRGLTKKYEAI